MERSMATWTRSSCRMAPRWSSLTALNPNERRGSIVLKRFLGGVAVAILVQAVALAQQPHPDLSGVWSYAIDRAPAALKKEVNGAVTIQKIDQSARHGDATSIRGVLPSTPKPSYK